METLQSTSIKTTNDVGGVFAPCTIRFIPKIISHVESLDCLRRIENASCEWRLYARDVYHERVVQRGQCINIPMLDSEKNVELALDQFRLFHEYGEPPQKIVIIARNAFAPAEEFSRESPNIHVQQQKFKLVYFLAKLVHEHAQHFQILQASCLYSVHKFFDKYFDRRPWGGKYTEYLIYWVHALKNVTANLKLLETDVLWENALRYRNFEDILEAASGLTVLKIYARSLLVTLTRFSQPKEDYLREYPSIQHLTIAAAVDPDDVSNPSFVDFDDFSCSVEPIEDINIYNQLPSLTNFALAYNDDSPFEITDVKFLPEHSRRSLRTLNISGVRRDIREILPTLSKNLQYAQVTINFSASPTIDSPTYEDFDARFIYLACALQDKLLMPRLKRVDLEVTLPPFNGTNELTEASRDYTQHYTAQLMCIPALQHGSCFILANDNIEMFANALLSVNPSAVLPFKKLHVVVVPQNRDFTNDTVTARSSRDSQDDDEIRDGNLTAAAVLARQAPYLRVVILQNPAESFVRGLLHAILQPQCLSFLFDDDKSATVNNSNTALKNPIIIRVNDEIFDRTNKLMENLYEKLTQQQGFHRFGGKKVLRQWVKLERLQPDEVYGAEEVGHVPREFDV